MSTILKIGSRGLVDCVCHKGPAATVSFTRVDIRHYNHVHKQRKPHCALWNSHKQPLHKSSNMSSVLARIMFSMGTGRHMSTLCGEVDRYRGVHVDLTSQIPDDCNATCFDSILENSMKVWQENSTTSVWIKVPITQSHLIAVAARHGFLYHHAENQHAMLCQWLGDPQQSLLPRFATHQVGVAGCVVREDMQQVLVVKDKHRKSSFWKFPGGLANLGEDIGETAQREVFEETGVKSEFGGILALRQQHNQPGAFGRSDIYIICHMKPLSFEINPCNTEIEACEWASLYDLEQNAHNSAVTLRVAHLIRLGLERGFDEVDITSTEFKSIYKGLKYKLFNRHVNGDDMSSYIHSVTQYSD